MPDLQWDGQTGAQVLAHHHQGSIPRAVGRRMVDETIQTLTRCGLPKD